MKGIFFFLTYIVKTTNGHIYIMIRKITKDVPVRKSIMLKLFAYDWLTNIGEH